jgi:hypothetical protein
MLVEFSVENYRSIRERVTLSLVASRDTEHPENFFSPGIAKNLSLLKSVVVYGANASGKSNLIRALAFMRRLVLSSASGQLGDAIKLTPFRLDPQTTTKPSFFEVVFVADGQRYIYGFTADTEKVHEEWLTAARKKTRLLFHRSPEGPTRFGDSWQGDSRPLEKKTRANALFLSVAAQFNNPTATPVFEWFREKLRHISDRPEIHSEMAYTPGKLSAQPEFGEELARFAEVADLGIDRFLAQQVPLRDAKFWAEMDEDERAQLVSDLPKGPDTMVPFAKAVHKTANGSEVTFDLDKDESAGTRRLFALAAPWLHIVREGCVLLVDELESSLHPLITRFLLKLIHDGSTAAQLIATTHDCGLLDPELFRRDQIWFTEKAPETWATRLYSLWDYSPRKGEDIRSGYLKGRYGAIPFIGDLGFGKAEG